MDSAFFAVVDDEGGVCQPCSYWPLCAPVDCCMYPADELGKAYSEDDLPETVVNIFGDPEDLESYIYRKIPKEELGESAQYYINDNGSGIYINTNKKWVGEGGDEDRCLINIIFGDQFSACYSVTGFFVGSPVSVERISLCVWQAEVDGILVGLSFNSIEQKWYGFEDNTYLYPKMPDENQSSPLGEYGSPGSPDELVYLTVTEC
jgi:hypothetical protein